MWSAEPHKPVSAAAPLSRGASPGCSTTAATALSKQPPAVQDQPAQYQPVPGCRRLLEGCWFTLAAMEAAPAGAVAPGDLSRAEVLLKRAGARLFDHRTAALATAQSKPGQRWVTMKKAASPCSSGPYPLHGCGQTRCEVISAMLCGEHCLACVLPGFFGQALRPPSPCRYAMCPPSHGLTREDAAALAASRPDFKFGEWLTVLVAVCMLDGLDCASMKHLHGLQAKVIPACIGPRCANSIIA